MPCMRCGKPSGTAFEHGGYCYKCRLAGKKPPVAGKDDGFWKHRPGPPTRYLPWQPEYMDELAFRAELRLPLHSPGDAVPDLR